MKAAADRDKAVDLRITGYSYREIAEKMSCSQSTAYGRVKTGLELLIKSTNEKSEHLRQVQMLRLEKLWRALAAKDRTPRNTDSLLRILDRQAKLHGLDKPTKLEVEATITGIDVNVSEANT